MKRLVILTGARQTGKTTLARYKFPQLNYLNLDSPENRESLRAMKKIAEHLGNAWRGGVVIYQGDAIKKLAEPGIWAVPSRRLFI